MHNQQAGDGNGKFIEHFFTYHSPEGKEHRFEAIREAAKNFAITLQTLATLNPDGTLSLHSLNSCIAHDWGMQLDCCGKVRVELTSEEIMKDILEVLK